MEDKVKDFDTYCNIMIEISRLKFKDRSYLDISKVEKIVKELNMVLNDSVSLDNNFGVREEMKRIAYIKMLEYKNTLLKKSI